MGKILKNLSILQKFLFINLIVFIFIIIITFFYLGAIQKNLINEKQKNHKDIITQTILNLEKSNIKLNEYGISEFLFSKKSRFPYFEKLDRVIFFDDKLNWIGDTRSIPSSTLLFEELNEEPSEKNLNNQENKNVISHGKLKLDPSQLECEWDGNQLPDKLTTTEFKIVEELAKRPGMIKERALLMDVAYREDTDIEDRTIDSHVKRIRKKFKKVDCDFSAIETRYGSGYRWNVK